MNKEVIITVAEDDPGHMALLKMNFKRSGILNDVIHFENGKETLDFFFMEGDGPHMEPGSSYLLLLDIRMPKVDGIEVLKKIKGNEATRKIPIIVITTTDDPDEINRCYDLGCNIYIVKPVQYDDFVNAVKQLGLFLMVMEVHDSALSNKKEGKCQTRDPS